MCIVNFAISPTTHPVEVTDQQFTITADQLPPPLDDESYYCVFGVLGSSLIEGDLIPSVTFTGLTCIYNFTVEQISNGSDDTAVVDFSLRSNLTNVNFITIDNGFTFFDCSTHASCRSCLSSNNLCGWCLYDKKCTSSSDQCRVSTDWINTGSSNNTSCPLILSRNITNGVSEYQQPVGVLRNLSLNAINLPAPNENYTYQCVISYNGLESRIQAEYTGPNNGLVCIPRVNDFEELVYVDNATVSVLWTGPNVTYNLETIVDPLTVILYNCTSLAGECPSCLSAANESSLDCGWCHDSGSCEVTESCSASSSFTANNSDTCPQSPQITMVNPNSGPYQGGTTITITGTDLGVVVQDIISATIGGAPCMVDSDGYQPRIEFSCITSQSSARSYVNVIITIDNAGTIRSTNLSGGFRYAEVTITDFSPKRIPQSGNVTIDIFGSNFNISNSALARIRIVDTSCSINQQTLNSTFVQCITGRRLQRGIGPVVFIIDDSVTESEGNFTYTNDPRLFALSNNKVIKSGGVMVVFRGSDLDVVQTVLIIDIVDGATISNNAEVDMSYNTSCSAESDGEELSCIFPAIPPDLLNDIITGTLELRYSLVASSVPGLDNLHLMPQFMIQFVDDPVVTPINETLSYQVGSNPAITITGINLDAVDRSEIKVTVGNGTCAIITLTTTAVSCIPPQPAGNDIANVTVRIGENLSYTVGKLSYTSITSTNSTSTMPTSATSTTTETMTIIITVIITAAVVLIIMLLIILIVYAVRKKLRKQTHAFKGATDIIAYNSAAYSPHYELSDPGADHAYELVGKTGKMKTTSLQDPPQADGDDTSMDDYIKMELSARVGVRDVAKEADVGDYVKMNSFWKATDQDIAGGTESDVDEYIKMNPSFRAGVYEANVPTGEHVQATDHKDILPTDNDNQ